MASRDPGPRDHLVTRALKRDLEPLAEEVLDERPLDPAEGPDRLARHAAAELRSDLGARSEAAEQAQQINEVLADIAADGEDGALVSLPPRVLYGIRGRSSLGAPVDLPPAPATPFSQSDLLVNGEGQPNIGSELRAELRTADSVDLICAFVIGSGVRHLREALESVVERNGRVRVITTTYMGATQKAAVDLLFDLGAEIRVALDARTTKLHAKAWLLERASGLSTAYIGSSNLSHTALFDGLEWNVRLSSMDAAHVIDRVRMTFESHWESEHFDHYDPAVNGDDLARALAEHDRRSLGETSTISFANLDVRPYPHQARMLETLTIERERHDRHRNLVVAATGTGKTVVAALDYRHLCEAAGRSLSLLFVAHRERILKQSLATYRAVLRSGSFGEIHGGGRVAQGKNVFAMVQALAEQSLDDMPKDAFDVVVIDEFHHAAAPTYDRLLNHLRPKELLGLTATPERLDGKDVTEWFDHRVAVELRLWEAIDQGFLVPFQYFGVADGTDLRDLAWRRGGYITADLSNLFSNDDLRVTKLLQAIRRIVLAPGSMKALGFCVSKEHAHYMAAKFTAAGLESVALTGDDPTDLRDIALRDLSEGRLRCVFSVEVLGEGVDVPDVNTILLLRPTQSATVFSQQLGRGLRRAGGKSHLTVIDLIGQHRREFRFEERLGAILDRRRGAVLKQVEDEFPFLPAGCTVDLDRQSRELVLDNLKAAVRRSRWATLVADLKATDPGAGLFGFLERFDHRVEDVYRGNRSWTALCRDAGHPTPVANEADLEGDALRAVGGLTHLDDPERVALYTDFLSATQPPRMESLEVRKRRLLTMLAWGLRSERGGRTDLDAFFAALWAEKAVRVELLELLAAIDQRSTTRGRPNVLPPEIPLALHARYSRNEVVAALGYAEGVKPKVTQGGILWVPQAQADVFFIDLHKAERDYSPTTMYRDYAISRDLFHWESQSRQHGGQATVQRYIDHAARDTRVLLFVRERKRSELGTAPFTFLGPATYVDHKGGRPVAFTWRLPVPMPEALFEVARSVAAA
jgi:superfamily II DNA or RNA helicase/HKD family nuclease